MYDPSIGRWNVVDEMSEKYFQNTSYGFSANNPILFYDYDGRDFIVSIDPENNTITISGTFYTTQEDKESADQAIQFWNDQSGNFEYTAKDGKEERVWDVNFDLTVETVETEEGEPEMAALNRAFSEDQPGGANVFTVVGDSELPSNTNGRTTGGNFIRVKDSQKDAETGTHEVGHALGLHHSSIGLMTAASSDPKRSSNIEIGSVRNIIRYPLNGKVNKGPEGRPAGKGQVRNLQAFPIGRKLKKGKVKSRN